MPNEWDNSPYQPPPFSEFLLCSGCKKRCWFTSPFTYELASSKEGFFCCDCTDGKRGKEKQPMVGTGLIWRNPDNEHEWFRECHQCQSIVKHIGKLAKNNAADAIRRKRVCKQCRNKNIKSNSCSTPTESLSGV